MRIEYRDETCYYLEDKPGYIPKELEDRYDRVMPLYLALQDDLANYYWKVFHEDDEE